MNIEIGNHLAEEYLEKIRKVNSDLGLVLDKDLELKDLALVFTYILEDDDTKWLIGHALEEYENVTLAERVSV